MNLRQPACCWRQLRRRPLLANATHPSQPWRTDAVTMLPHTTRRGYQGWSSLPSRARPRRFNQVNSGLPVPTTGPAAALKRKEGSTPVRTGLLAVKKGMTAFMGRRGARIPCTVLQLEDLQVVTNKTRQANGYWAVQIGMGERLAKNVGAPMLGYFEAKGLAPSRKLAEFRVRNASGLLPVGVRLLPDWFHVGQWVDVRSNSHGQGFAGGMKRHGFAGQGASHGNSLNHRTMGSLGPSQGGGARVHPGKKMPGRMGNERVTVQNLSILLVDNDLGILVVKGAVAGPKGCIVRIQDAVKKPPPSQQHIEKTLADLRERFPNAQAHVDAARLRHLELKQARKEGRIEQLMKSGMTLRTPNFFGPEEVVPAGELEWADETESAQELLAQATAGEKASKTGLFSLFS